MSQSPENMSLAGRLVVGGLFAGIGLLIEALALGILPVDEGSVEAPLWVALTAGGMFTLVGLWIMTAGTAAGDVLGRVVAPAVAVGLLSMLHWVAFGPGVRQCSGGFSIPFLSVNRPVGDLECRIAFGYGALLFDGVILATAVGSFAEKRLEGRAQKVAKTLGNSALFVALLPLVLVVMVIGLFKKGVEKLRGKA